MPRKKIEPITTLGNTDKLTVQKSLPLFALWRSDLTLAEFKILDTYLARIDSHKPEKRAVVFEKGEIEKALGVKKINNPDLLSRLKHLMSNVVEIPDSSSRKGIRLVTLFEEAVAEQDANGLWQIKLECTTKAMKYFFNIENLGYLRYKLRCITSLSSRYAYIMFIYLEANRFRRSWEVDLNELKIVLDCDKVETYAAFKEFNKQVLKRIQTEIQAKTECRYSYNSIKKGRSVVAIRFTLQTLPQLDPVIDPNQTTLQQYLQNRSEPALELYRDALSKDGNPCEFSNEQLEEIRQMLLSIPESKLPPEESGNIELRRYHYLSQKYAALIRRDAQHPIKHRFNYLRKIMQQDSSKEE